MKAADYAALTQLQQEALLDLLIFATYADQKLTLAEQDFIDRVEKSLLWASPTALENYVRPATARVRDNLRTAEHRAALLTDISLRLASPRVRSQALEMVSALMLADNELRETEQVRVAEIRRVLKV